MIQLYLTACIRLVDLEKGKSKRISAGKIRQVTQWSATCAGSMTASKL